MENPLTASLKRATLATATNEVLGHIKEALRLLSNRSLPEDYLTEQYTKLLSRLSHTKDYPVLRMLTKLYCRTAEIIPSNNSNLLIPLVNDMLLLSDKYRGSELAADLSISAKHVLQTLSNNAELDSIQREEVNKLLESYSKPEIESKLWVAIEDLKRADSFGINRLMDILSSFRNLQEQSEFISTGLDPIISMLELSRSREIQHKLLRVLDFIIFQPRFKVKVTEENEVDLVQSYYADEIKYHNPVILNNILRILKVIVNADILIVQNCVRYVIRLWEIYPSHRSELYEIILVIVQRVAEKGSDDYKCMAAALVSEILTSVSTEEDFKNELKQNASIQALICNEALAASGEVSELETEFKLENLNPTSFFPLSIQVPASDTASITLEVPEPNCIVAWGFATEQMDVGYIFKKIDEEEKVIMSSPRVQCDKEPCLQAILVPSPGLYTFTWDNTYSWFTAKTVRYRLSLLRPLKSKSDSKTVRTPVILRYNEDSDMPDITYSSANTLEIGVHIQGNKLTMKSSSISDIATIETEEEIPIAIAGFIEQATNEVSEQYRRKLIGIVGREILDMQGLEELGSTIVARDCEAIGLLMQSVLHSHTLISVLKDEGIRSAVLHKGRVLRNEEGNVLGDIGQLRGIDLVMGVANLMSLFGPATVMITGEIEMGIDEVKEQLTNLVPISIMEKSKIRLNSDLNETALRAALKLHNLYTTFKFGIV